MFNNDKGGILACLKVYKDISRLKLKARIQKVLLIAVSHSVLDREKHGPIGCYPGPCTAYHSPIK